MRCPKCNSEKVEGLPSLPAADYDSTGEYYARYRCIACGFEFSELMVAEESIFDNKE